MSVPAFYERAANGVAVDVVGDRLRYVRVGGLVVRTYVALDEEFAIQAAEKLVAANARGGEVVLHLDEWDVDPDDDEPGDYGFVNTSLSF